MNIPTILADFDKEQCISPAVINSIQNDEVIRIELQNYFRNFSNHHFALALLQTFMTIRQTNYWAMPIEDLMYAAYLVGLHQQIEDCLVIWTAQNLDSNTLAEFEVELILFAGLEPTLNFLQLQNDAKGQAAYQYLLKFAQNNSFENLNEYFSVKLIPWYV